tara:strand:- start:733 stop:1548 length:816 start_codon:yes stop_codon:yes gene_type:complete
MAINLNRAGYRLQVHTRSRQAEQNPGLHGALRCSNPADAARGVDLLMLCVSDDQAVNTVLFGANGAIETLQPGCVVIDCSTITPANSIAAAERLAIGKIDYIDAPLTGGTEGARAGTLTVLVGGQDTVLQRARPVLDVIGGTIHHFGPVGSGQQVKAVNQVLVAGTYAAVAEAMALGQRLNLPMDAVVDALRSGAAGSWALDHRAKAMLNRDYPLGFRLALHHKDLSIALNAARETDLHLPVTQLVQQMEADLMASGHEDQDVSCLRQWLK